jgi:hypothetical protein
MKLLSFLVPCAVASVAVAAPVSDLLYANNADTGVIKTYTPATAASGVRYLQNAQAISGLAANDAAQRLYVSFGSGGTISVPDNNLYTYDYSGNLLNSARMGNTSLGGTGGGVSMNGLTYANNTLYGVHQNGTTAGGGVYAIDPSNGNLTLAASLNSGSSLYNFQDIDYDEANGRFIGVNSTVSGTPGSASGLYSIVLPSTPGAFATVTALAALPSDAPTGNTTPDGLAYDDASGIVYLTYNRSTVISRYDLTNGTYLTSLTVPTQTQGASGDAAFATGYVGAVPEPTLLAALPLAFAALGRRRSK